MPSADQPQLSASTISKVFFVAHFKDRAVAIRRNNNFTATIASVRNAFPALASFHSSQIILSATFSEFGDQAIEVNNELWAEVLPTLMSVLVSIGDDVQQDEAPQPTNMAMPILQEVIATDPRHDGMGAQSEEIMVSIDDTHGILKDLVLSLVHTSTIQRLKELILCHSNQLPKYLRLSYGAYSNLEDHEQLQHYGIRDGSTVSVFTEFKIYLVTPKDGPGDTIHEVTVTTSASVRVLRLLALAKGDREPFGQVITSASETLFNNQALGSYYKIVPGCRIAFNRFIPATASNEGQYEVSVHIRHPLGNNEGEEVVTKYTIMPGSTILELKLLILDRLQLPLSRQKLMMREFYKYDPYENFGIASDTYAFVHRYNYPHQGPPVCYLEAIPESPSNLSEG